MEVNLLQGFSTIQIMVLAFGVAVVGWIGYSIARGYVRYTEFQQKIREDIEENDLDGR